MSTAVHKPIAQTRHALLLIALTALLLISVLAITGVPIATALLLTGFVLWQAVFGAVTWRWLRPTAPLLEVAGAALAVGTAVSALAGVLSATAGLGPWGWLVPSAVALALRIRRRPRSIDDEVERGWSFASLLGFFAAVIPGLAIVLYTLRRYPLTWVGGWDGYHPDMPFFEAISVHIAQYGAFSTPFLTEGAVRYHWLSYTWAGQLTLAADAAPFVTVTRVLPVVALLGSAAMVASWTRQLSKHAWTPTLAGLLLSLGGFTGAVFGGVMTMDSPSQSMSVLWLIAFSIAVIHLAQTPETRWLGPILVGVLAFALVGAKVSAAAPAVAGVLLLTLVQALRRDLRSIRLLVATIVGAASGFFFFLFGSLGGGGLTLGALVDKASSQQGLNPIDTKYAVVAGTAILVLAVLPRWAGVLWLLTQRDWRWRPEVTYSLGLAGSSIAALVAFNSFNEVWFSSTVSGPLAAISAVGAGDALARITARPRASQTLLLAVSTGVALVSFFIVWQLWATGASGGNLWVPTWRWFGPIAVWGISLFGGFLISWWALRQASLGGILAGTTVLLVLASVPGRLLGVGTGLVAAQENGIRNEWFNVGVERYAVGRDTQTVDQWTDAQMTAAAWLRDNAPTSALLGTNLTLSPFVPAVTHMPTYVSGIRYQSPYGYPWMSPIMLDHEDLTWNFIDSPSSSTVKPLCAANVEWLWIDLSRIPERDWEPFYSTRLAEQDTVIAQLNPSACR